MASITSIGPAPIVLAGLCALFAFVLAMRGMPRRSRARGNLSLPPGPVKAPIIGNLLDVPRSQPWVSYRDWSRKYDSDLVHFSILGKHTVIVNSAHAANELYVKRSSRYSDRPPMTAMKLLGLEWPIGIVPYGSTWRLVRRLFHEETRPEVYATYESYREKAVHAFLLTLITQPQDFKMNIKHLAGRILMRAAYGFDIRSQDDPYIEIAEKTLGAANVAASFSGIVLDLIPILKYMPTWFPGAGFKRYASKTRPEVSRAVLDKPWAVVAAAKRGDLNGSEGSSVAGNLLDKYGDDSSLHEVLKTVPATVYLAGVETTVSSLLFFFMAMALYPDVQKKAQHELDSVLCGALPTLVDRTRLPYTTALVSEVFRWHPAVPLGIPHSVTEDDIYEDMRIPGGCMVIGNIWAITHDPDQFPRPETFNPAHFISTTDGGMYSLDDSKTYGSQGTPFPDDAFGFGRRLCPGRDIGVSSIWLIIASVLCTFDISQVKDESGREVPISDSCTDGLISYPGPYECSIRPRKEVNVENLVSRSD
ncbi:unnamed protein product [Peniophora sp. CBMAI 1063]|nr:unnamed protein product [Peniophora sp. CBMAI 1063]